jgi:hypothetical protein
MPLSLSDIQLERLLQAAELLPVHARDSFLRSVANRVADLPQIGAAEIETAIRRRAGRLRRRAGRLRRRPGSAPWAPGC